MEPDNRAGLENRRSFMDQIKNTGRPTAIRTHPFADDLLSDRSRRK